MAAAALVALLAVLVVMHSGASGAQAAMNRTSAVRQLRSSGGGGGWQAAKATWYGAPNGAGPNDNGTYVRSNVSACLATTASYVARCAMLCTCG